MRTQTKNTQATITHAEALDILKKGNERFVLNVKAQRDLKSQVYETKQGQFPFAAILSCIDSRVPTELVFDQGIGDIFSIRIAGNIVNNDILGSLEFACKVAGSKVIVVLGHTKCGAISAACDNVQMGNITDLLDKIKPAIEMAAQKTNLSSTDHIDKVAQYNVQKSIELIRSQSKILNEMEKNDEIEIVGAIYDVSNGHVTFFI